jgi:hypothetical protein
MPANACNLCVSYPEKSAADVLIESAVVALAREDPKLPFSLAPVEVLKGNHNGAHIELFLDSATRQALAGNPSSAVVVVQEKEGGGWRRLMLANSQHQSLVRRILLFAPQWQGARGQLRRVEFFLPWFGHEDPVIYELAYLEIARAPYGVIKRVSRVVPREQLERILNRPEYTRWRSLAFLILAHRGEAKDKQFLAESFRNAERFQLSSNLAALAAASIELEGARAISYIEDRYFARLDRSDEELREVLKALSLHGSEGRVQLRDHIVAAYGKLLEVHPEMVAFAAADLLDWNRTEWKEELAELERGSTRLDDLAREALRQYLNRAATVERGRIDR